MRLTLSSSSPELPDVGALDVDADVGATIGRLRPHLARLTGVRDWAHAPVSVAGRALDDAHAVGHAPLVTGAVLCLGPGTPDPAVEAVSAPWHVAVVRGPAAGSLVGVRSQATVGTLRVRVRQGRVPWRRQAHVQVRRRWRWRRWRAGHVLDDGPDRYELRTAASARGEQVPTRAEPHREPVTAWVASLVGAAALAAVTRQPVFLAAALAGPLVMLVPRLVRRGHVTAGEIRDVAAVVARSAVGAGSAPARLAVAWGPDGTLAVVGPRVAALAHARGVVVGTVGSHADVRVVVRPADSPDWRWTRWATDDDALPEADAPDTLVVVDDPTDRAEVARWRRTADPRHRLLLVLPTAAAVPAWCGATVEVETGAEQLGTGQLGALQPGMGSIGTGRLGVDGPSVELAEAQLRRAVALRPHGSSALPTDVALGDLPGVPRPSASAISAAWSSAAPSLAPLVGRGAGGAVERLDLARDGPHALVGGTTGAGKSELLVALVLACALAHPPERLAVLLVDFKGGTGLGPVAALPHVVDHVSDLDPAAARRLLVGLRAELDRRERILAAAGARDLRDLDPLDPGTPPLLLVVVDELRALVDDVPDAPATLARLAALGRSLGVHLVLATQRPAGVVGADLRANVALRIALRVNDEADSSDLVGVPDAARIEPKTPGRALVRTADGHIRELQAARAVTAGRRAPVRLAGVLSTGTPWRPGAPTAVDDVTAWVRAARTSAGHADDARVETAEQRDPFRTRRPDVPWLPALPDVVRAADLAPSVPVAARALAPSDPASALVPSGTHPAPGVVPSSPPRGWPVALSDVPAEQRRGVVRWDADEGHLLVLGGPRSGRSTTLVTVGTAALRAGRVVHGAGLPAWATDHLARVGGAWGTFVGLDEPRLLARLLRLLGASTVEGRRGDPGRRQIGLGSATDDARPVLLVDGLDIAVDALGRLRRGAGADLLTAVWRGGSRAVALAATGDVRGAMLSHASSFRDRLVLPVPDVGLDVFAGVPAALSGRRGVPGRAVHLGPQGAALCQVALASDARTHREPDTAPVRLRPVPTRVDLPSVPPADSDGPVGPGGPVPIPVGPGGPVPVRVAVGVGGDAAEPVAADLGAGLLVVGPPGSGRTTALGVLATGARTAGMRIATVGVEHAASSEHLAPSDLPHWSPSGPTVLLVDDADELERADPALADHLAALVAEGSVRVVAAVTSAAAASAYRGVAAALLRRRALLVLDPADAASADVVGPDAGWFVDPVRPAGRGVLVEGRSTTLVQVYRTRGPSS